MIPIEYLIVLCCAFIYAIGGIYSKRAMSSGAGVGRTLVAYNWLIFLGFIPLALTQAPQVDWSLWHWPILAGALFFFGQLGTFAAIRVGDVSVQSPMMGTKMVFVAGFSVLLGAEEVPLSWWIGAFLSMIGIFLLSGSPIQKRRGTLFAILLSLMSAACFGLCDVLVAAHAMSFSSVVFPVFMMGVAAVFSLFIVPFFRAGFRDMGRDTAKWFWIGGAFLTLQGMGLYFALSHYGQATALNILYSSRGIWSVVIVWTVGKWFANSEQREAGHFMMVKRLSGAMLMMVAIVLVLQ